MKIYLLIYLSMFLDRELFNFFTKLRNLSRKKTIQEEICQFSEDLKIAVLIVIVLLLWKNKIRLKQN